MWMFLLDHTHHKRWMLVFIKDFLDFHLFSSEDCFAVKITKRISSNNGTDQAIS